MRKSRFTIAAALMVRALPALAADACLNHCEIESAEPGAPAHVACYCQEARFLPNDSFFALRQNAPAKFARELRKRIKGASPVELELASRNACQADVQALRKANVRADELRPLALLAERPLCECVRNRVAFPLRREKTITRAGVQGYQYSLQLATSARRGPERDATLMDYQECVVARMNYRAPASCAAVVCQEKPHACAAGRELVNVADSGSCCPLFECRLQEMHP